ncbi:hypothetical protein OG871_18340 [Kitasatospora sp. NBC_00374]|uniref:hypothetical protein n=1 Tax=Kitasatospora sp. NBC_00374 TaxID=2975964 RepID=UPI0032452DAC
MSTNRSRRIDRDTAEQLLAGAGADPEAGQAALTGHPALAGLLAAAAAQAVDAEPAGEQRALAAFREARISPATPTSPAAQPRRRTMADTALARAFSAKALAAAFAATALGGVAFAAGTGTLPPALGGGPAPGHRVTAAPAAPASSGPAQRTAPVRPSGGSAANGSVAPAHPSGSATPSGAVSPGGGSPGRADDPSDTAEPADRADSARLCRSLRERLRGGASLADVLKDPALEQLNRAAGGSVHTSAYCADVLHEKLPDPPSATKDGRLPGSGRTATATPAPSGERRG